MDEDKLIEKINKELIHANQAQTQENSGMARVCSRRAAGWAIQMKLLRDGVELNTPSAFDFIKYYSDLENLDEKIKVILDYLQVKVKKDNMDEDSYWPLPEIDLVSEAKWLVEELLGRKFDIS